MQKKKTLFFWRFIASLFYCKEFKFEYRAYRLMDRTAVFETANVGSIPTRLIVLYKIKNKKIIINLAI